MAESTKTHEVSEEDFKLLERAKMLKAALERVRSRAHDKKPFTGIYDVLGEALAWISWCALHEETIEFACNTEGEVSDDLAEYWKEELKQAFPDEKDPVWDLVCFDSFDSPFADRKVDEGEEDG